MGLAANDALVTADTSTGVITDQAKVATANLQDDAVTPAKVSIDLEVPPHGAGVFDKARSLYNWKSANTFNLRSALAKAKTGSRGVVAFIGDSITAASPAALEPSTDAFCIRLEKALESRGWPIAGDGPTWGVNSNLNTQTDNRWSIGAGWAGVSGQLYQLSTTNGATATYTSLRAGTIVDIYHVNNGSGPFTYNIDGAGPVTVTPAAGQTFGLVTVSGLADTTHSVVITTTSTASTFLVGVAVRRASGLQLVNFGYGGAQASNWMQTAWNVPGAIVNKVAPEFGWFMIGVNDAIAGVALATFKSNATAAINNWTGNGTGIGLMVAPPISIDATYLTYRQALYELADTLDVPLVDFYDHFVSYATYTGSAFQLDNNHPNATGELEMAELLARILS